MTHEDNATAARTREPVDAREVLERLAALPISSWSYLWDDESVRHIGPMAQDFRAAFGVGADDRRIDPADGQGIAFTAIKALHELLCEQQLQIDELRARLDRLG